MANEATNVDLVVIEELKKKGWVPGISLFYRKKYILSDEQKAKFGRSSIEPDVSLIDPITGHLLAVIEDKLEDEKKAFAQLRLAKQVLNPFFFYACSKDNIAFFDTTASGVMGSEFKSVDTFLSLEEMKTLVEVNTKKQNIKVEDIVIDTSIAGGYDTALEKERYYQKECITSLLEKYLSGKDKMLVHLATGLGKTRISVALCKALLENNIAKKILFVVDRIMLATQAKNDGFSLIEKQFTSSFIKTATFNNQRHSSIHIVVIDTLEKIYQDIPSQFYDLIIVDECHRSISHNRKLIFDHFACPRIGLTATPKIAVNKNGGLSPEDLAIRDTYALFGCDKGEPDYKFDIKRGIEEGFLAPYDVHEIKTFLTRQAEEDGILIDHVLDPNTLSRIALTEEQKVKLAQLEKQYLSPERCKRIAEEIKKQTQYGEKVILFGASQAHCVMLAKAINEVFEGEHSPLSETNYAESIISDNNEYNSYLKEKFKNPGEKPYVTVSVDIMSTGVDVPPVRYIGFAALTDSVGKYIQMVGRGTRIHPSSGKYSFKILDFTGLCKKMEDDGYSSSKPNKQIVVKKGSSGSGGGIPRPYFLIDELDPTDLIQRRVYTNKNSELVDNISLDKARNIFEVAIQNPQDPEVKKILDSITVDKVLSEEEESKLSYFISQKPTYLSKGQLQKIYAYPLGTLVEFVKHALGVKLLPSRRDLANKAYDDFVSSYTFNDDQLKELEKLKELIISNLDNKLTASLIFQNPIYSRMFSKAYLDELFNDGFDELLQELQKTLTVNSIKY